MRHGDHRACASLTPVSIGRERALYTGMSSGYQFRSLVEATTRKPQSPRSLASYSRWCNAICLRGAEIFVGVARRGQYFDTQLPTPSCAPARSFAA